MMHFIAKFNESNATQKHLITMPVTIAMIIIQFQLCKIEMWECFLNL